MEATDDDNDYFDTGSTGLIEEHYEPVDASMSHQSLHGTSQPVAVVSSICSRPQSDEVVSGSSDSSSVAVGSSFTSQPAAVVSSICSRPQSDEVVSGSSDSPSVAVGSSTSDDNNLTCQPWENEQQNELLKCTEFVRLTCGCRKANGKPCSSLFSEEHYAELRAQASFLTHEQLDLVILGSIMATIHKDDIFHGRHKPAKRQKTMMTYMHHGHHLCVHTYNFLHGIGSHRVKHVKASYITHGLATRTHGNSNKLPANTLFYRSTCYLVKFVQNYAEQNAILLPGRIPQFKRDDVKLLPCSDSKKVS